MQASCPFKAAERRTERKRREGCREVHEAETEEKRNKWKRAAHRRGDKCSDCVTRATLVDRKVLKVLFALAQVRHRRDGRGAGPIGNRRGAGQLASQIASLIESNLDK